MLIEKLGIAALEMKIYFILFPNQGCLGTLCLSIGRWASNNLSARPIYADTDV